MIHLHASYGLCQTVCGIACHQMPTYVTRFNRDKVTCRRCLRPWEGPR